VKNHVIDADKFNAYDPIAQSKYEYTIGWLKEWACTRQFGLGTYLPWDTQWVIESLSDSTIYMAYYTIAHILQGENNLNGDTSLSPGKIDPANLTDDVFNFIYRKGFSIPEDSKIDTDVLESCKKEFRYWYPMDLRVSAKDLIPNHLTMALYNHAAIWDDEPELWPKGYYTNGHVQVDAEKMSKSKGNFLMLNTTVNKYSADATRFACADAGDSIEDANFSQVTADTAIVSLSNEEAWILEVISAEGLRKGDDDLNFMDRVIINETNRLIKNTTESFSSMQFREGLKNGWFEMLLARNEYRSGCQVSGVPMHEKAINKWCEALCIMICPICPHWAEKVWKGMGREGFAVKAPWPIADDVDKILTRQVKFLRDSLKTFRAQCGKAKKGWTQVSILVTDSYPDWKVNTLKWMQEKYDDGFPPDFMKQLKSWTSSLPDKKLFKFTMQFASFTKREVEDVGPTAMDLVLPFDQKSVIVDSENYLKSQLNLKEVDVIKLDDAEASSNVPDRMRENVVPGKAYLWFR
jgi:leucyl-tRNA synthetase